VPAHVGESFEPQYEALSSALAAMGRWLGENGRDSLFAPVTALTAARTAVAVLAMAVAVVTALTVRARTFTDSLIPAAVAVVLGAVFVAAAVLVGRWWPGRPDMSGGFGWMGAVLLAVGAGCFPPGRLGAPHGLIGLVVVALGSIVISVAARRRSLSVVAAAVVTVCGVLGLVAAARMWKPVSAQVLGICVLWGLVMLVRLAPTIALWVARVRPPYFGSITGRDVFARSEGMPVDTVTPVSEEEEDQDDEVTDITARGEAIAASARLVNAVQIGMCAGAAAMLPAAVWAVVKPDGPRQWAAIMLAGLVAAIFITQARGFAAKYQAVALVCGAVGAVCSGAIKYALAWPGDSPAGLLWPAAVVVGVAGCGLAAALLVPATKFRPLIRLAVEWLEVAALVAALPLAAWLGGLFSWIRP
jgi:ESX secretion system protein EccD